jgi:NAD(P)-dependent dehydrogenase (short-subunit alcohol dehydrogenase family)
MAETMGTKTAVVTGASAGIGKSTARMLAAAGWSVIGTGRDAGRSAAAQDEIRAAAAPGAKVDLLRADFTEMKDVAHLAREIAARAPRIDVLINNAGGVRDKLYITSENLEATFAANHLAPFLLTQALMPQLQSAAAAAPAGSVRVIAVSSSGHMACPGMKWDDLNMFENFTTGGAYCQAKLANILFTRELARRAGPDGIIAQSMHPGRIKSNFASHGDAAMQSYMENAETSLPDEPARTLVWLATSDDAGKNPGRYFHDMQELAPAPQALDDLAARRLWDESEAILAKIFNK